MPFPSPSEFVPLTICTVCSNSFTTPTTLQCGHSVCSSHLPMSEPCCQPLPHNIAPNLPEGSRVRFTPAPAAPEQEPVDPPAPSPDVSLNNILALITRAQHWLEEEAQRSEWLSTPPDHHSDDSDDDEGRSRSHRPRKRRRRLSNLDSAIPQQPQDLEEDPDGDLLTHLREESVRQRTLRPDQPLLRADAPHTTSTRDAPLSALDRFEKELLTELTCGMCFMLFHEPVTTSCQHTFCSRCLHRSLDHSLACPLCRHELPRFHEFRDKSWACNKTILSLLLRGFSETYAERGETLEAEERDARLDTPIFVAQLSFPGTPTLLHFFEPRYRLMLRRCLESPLPHFGMILPPRVGAPDPSADFGTMLEVRSVQMLPDGRSMVETFGVYRFRILERGTLDGYMVGRVERIDDTDDEEESDNSGEEGPVAAPSTVRSTINRLASSISLTRPLPPTEIASSSTGTRAPTRIPTNAELMANCREFLMLLRQGTAPWVVQRMNNTYGPMPVDPAAFSFWVALVLPIDEHEKAKLLPIRSPHMRLRLVSWWISQLNDQWWFRSGCVII